MGAGHLPCRLRATTDTFCIASPFHTTQQRGVPGEPGVAVQTEPPSVGQREAPGEETEKGLREARREKAKGKNKLEGSQVGQRGGTCFLPRSRDGKASKPCCSEWIGVWPQLVGDSHTKSHVPFYDGHDSLRTICGALEGQRLWFNNKDMETSIYNRLVLCHQ